jgi:hypothetical protein
MAEHRLKSVPLESRQYWHPNPLAPLPFFGSVHSKILKVDCFYKFTEVFILKGLTGQFCTKIVQDPEVF